MFLFFRLQLINKICCSYLVSFLAGAFQQMLKLMTGDVRFSLFITYIIHIHVLSLNLSHFMSSIYHQTLFNIE